MNEDMSPLNNLKRMNEEECPFFDDCDIKVSPNNPMGVGCLNLKHKGCEEYVKRRAGK